MRDGGQTGDEGLFRRATTGKERSADGGLNPERNSWLEFANRIWTGGATGVCGWEFGGNRQGQGENSGRSGEVQLGRRGWKSGSVTGRMWEGNRPGETKFAGWGISGTMRRLLTSETHDSAKRKSQFPTREFGESPIP